MRIDTVVLQAVSEAQLPFNHAEDLSVFFIQVSAGAVKKAPQVEVALRPNDSMSARTFVIRAGGFGLQIQGEL